MKADYLNDDNTTTKFSDRANDAYLPERYS